MVASEHDGTLMMSGSCSGLSKGQRVGGFQESLALDCKVIDSGDGRLVTTMFVFEETLDKSYVDVAKKVLDRFVLHHRPFCSYRTLKDTYMLRILVKDGLNIFCCPQGILRSLTSVDTWNFHMPELTFLNHTSKLASSMGMKGTDTNTGRNLLLLLHLHHLGVEGSSIVVTTTSQFDMVTSIKDSADETSLDGQRSHTCNHNRRFTEKSRKRHVEVDFTITNKGRY